jgi:hypothetical protein
LALGKAVFASSNQNGDYSNKGFQNVVDGRTGVTDFKLLFHTSYELYPWMTITLGRLSIVKSVTIYNRVDNHGKFSIINDALIKGKSNVTTLSAITLSCSSYGNV